MIASQVGASGEGLDRVVTAIENCDPQLAIIGGIGETSQIATVYQRSSDRALNIGTRVIALHIAPTEEPTWDIDQIDGHVENIGKSLPGEGVIEKRPTEYRTATTYVMNRAGILYVPRLVFIKPEQSAPETDVIKIVVFPDADSAAKHPQLTSLNRREKLWVTDDAVQRQLEKSAVKQQNHVRYNFGLEPLAVPA